MATKKMKARAGWVVPDLGHIRLESIRETQVDAAAAACPMSNPCEDCQKGVVRVYVVPRSAVVSTEQRLREDVLRWEVRSLTNALAAANRTIERMRRSKKHRA
jgi:hypothetical protein